MRLGDQYEGKVSCRVSCSLNAQILGGARSVGYVMLQQRSRRLCPQQRGGGGGSPNRAMMLLLVSLLLPPPM